MSPSDVPVGVTLPVMLEGVLEAVVRYPETRPRGVYPELRPLRSRGYYCVPIFEAGGECTGLKSYIPSVVFRLWAQSVTPSVFLPGCTAETMECRQKALVSVNYGEKIKNFGISREAGDCGLEGIVKAESLHAELGKQTL